MASKLVVFVLVVTICKVHSTVVRYFPCSDEYAPNQASCDAPQFQQQNFQRQSSNCNKGIKASPQLQLVPGQNYNFQPIPCSELNRGQLLNLGYNIPQQNIQICQACQNSGCNTPQQSTQGPTSSNFGCNSPQQNIQIQPSLCGPSSVITAPVSTITIPPNDATTIIDYSLSNCLANALQMMIANDFMSCTNNNNQEVQTPETAPGFDFAGLMNCLNANQQCGIPVTKQVTSAPSQCQVTNDMPAVSVNDWENLLDRLRNSGQCDCDFEGVMNYLNQQNGQNTGYKSSQKYPKYSQKQPTNNCCGGTDCAILEALAAYFGCDVSEVSSNSYPSVSEIYFPEEIPAQLICTYGYMPTTVPVVSFGVQPVNVGDASNGCFVVGC